MISIKKIELAKQSIKNKCEICKDKAKMECYKCLRWEGFIEQMALAEIPMDYWFRSMKNFYGADEFRKIITETIENIDDIYKNGENLYVVGERGRGKTMATCCILKKVLLKHYSALYINLSDLVTRIITVNPYLKLYVKEVDFLVIDEIDNRFFPTESSMELYGAQLETILRSRLQNKLPTIMCSNNVDIGLIFKGEFKKSFQSLFSQFVKTVVVSGPDARKNGEKLDD